MIHFLHLIGAALGWLAIVVAACGVVYSTAAALVFRRYFAAATPAPIRHAAVTLVKPLYGAEPRLYENLASFLALDHAGPVQLLCGIQRRDDPAIAVVEALRADYPDAQIDLVIDGTVHGASGKLSNLINMEPLIRHDVVVLSDSDIAVAPDYLAQILRALDQPKTGIVTCVYAGRGDTGFWSRFGAAGVSYQFMLGLVFGVANKLAAPCMGSTIAMTRDTLHRIGGFARFADKLADDYAMGEAVRALGLEIALPPMLVDHAFDERSLPALWRHELRWGATVRDVAFWPYVGIIIGLPLPVAILSALYWPTVGLILCALAVVARLVVVRNVDATVGRRIAPLWMALAHDGMSFAIYIVSFFVRSVDWRGATLTMKTEGRIVAAHKIQNAEQRA
ncbi:bacteriohopanetetrol glucosamine biosynthesis glycosyltransferase HpnI [Sphingomonas sp. PAMC 26617]|uniref:bacteriohopanetetrol glucosamine biosynthesis glycosyltransferase HpnI n=1 Tax=Sphingomonas sp. PAMC 26617 TaxID=1112216 RepID=UPI000288B8DC|nr:bacteriohopanetetrol glucosamine biosynthesis glycosyltransferase HpnI [Sphingomonas sp. PAMC 26617]